MAERPNSHGSRASFEAVTRSSAMDEQELRAAALEQLRQHPKPHRAALLPVPSGKQLADPASYEVVDVKKLNYTRKQTLLRGAMGSDGQDNEPLLSKMAERMQKAGVEVSRVEVRFQRLNVATEVFVGNRALPSVTNSAQGLLEFFLQPLGLTRSAKSDFTILHDVSGVLKAGRACLLLGPPGSGKTTLLKALAGKVAHGGAFKVGGRVTYNGQPFDSFLAERTAGYVAQTDSHLPAMTVRETFNFAARSQGVGHKADELRELRQREEERGIPPDPAIDAFMKANATFSREHITTELVLKLLGLDVCADTPVGDAMTRGISGGQRKRVTTGEIIVGPRKVLFLDEISTGLDSATTFTIAKTLVNFAHLRQATIMVSLLQPPPETFELFDDVMLLAQGQVVYFGPREQVMPFFEGLGFTCPPRRGVADFLQDVTLEKDQPQYWADRSTKHAFMRVSEMVAAYRKSEVGQAMAAALEAPPDAGPKDKSAIVTTKYALPWYEMLRTNFSRDFRLMARDTFLFKSRSFQICVLAFITATIFIHPGTGSLAAGNQFLLEIFLASLVSIFAGFAKIPETVLTLPVFYRQRADRFYPAWAYLVPKIVLDIPLGAYEALLWVLITYWALGFAPEAGRFFVHLLVLFLTNQCSIAIFRMCGAVGRSIVPASTTGIIALFAVIFSGGVMIARFSIPGWWIWLYWASPIAFSVRAMAVNEFTAARWDAPYAPDPTRRLGDFVLENRGFQTQHWWVWVGVAALLGYAVLFNLITLLALAFLPPPGGKPTVPPHVLKSAEEAKQAPASEDAHAIDIPAAPRHSLQLSSARGGRVADSPAADQGQDVEAAVAQQDEGETVSARAIRQARDEGLPFPPMVYAFRDVRYSVPLPRGAPVPPGSDGRQLELLKGISGAFRPGVLTALMGASGAGKTTLMDVLAGRKTGGKITGEMCVNGYPKDPISLARVMGYVEQNDTHSPQATVAEALAFSAALRVARALDAATVRAHVANVMDLVDLTPLAGALVGLPGLSGLSVEQRKRLTIAVELVANPSIIFLDEPTSGLDARAAATVMRAVKNTVRTGRTVVCTIHQPSPSIFEAFDELLLLQRGGTTIYNGPLGPDARDLVSYFEGLGLRPLPRGYNPATWMLELTSAAAEEASGKAFAEVYDQSGLKQRTMAQVEQFMAPQEGLERLQFDTLYAKPRFAQYKALLVKFNTMYWRTPEYNFVRALVTVILGFVIGTIYWNQGLDRSTEAGITNVLGAANAATIFLGAFYSLNVQPVVAVERTVFYRERAAQMYAALPYALAQGTVELPYLIVQSIVYTCIVYFCIGFQTDAGKFFWFLAFLFLTQDYFTHVGIMNVCLTPTIQISTILSTTLFGAWNILSGFFISKPQIRGYWIWAYYLNPLSFSTYGLVASQLGDVDSQLTLASGGTTTVRQYLQDTFGFQHSFIGWCLFILIGYSLTFRLVAAVALKRLNFQNR